MHITLEVNGHEHSLDVSPNTTLLQALRQLGYYSVKHGCEDGSCGACTVLIDGEPRLACVTPAAAAQGHTITTTEAIGEHPQKGWRESRGLDPIQQAFVVTGAIQCGYCTPAYVMATEALLARNPDPDEAEIRDALGGILCRCTGYKKIVEAVRLAAAWKRGEEVALPDEPPVVRAEDVYAADQPAPEPPAGPAGPAGPAVQVRPAVDVLPKIRPVPQVETYRRVGKPDPKVDAVKLVQGKPAFAADLDLRGMLYAKVLFSPVPHARIKRIDVSKARALPGVHAVLTYKDIPRVAYSTAGQSDPIPGPLDSFSLPRKVRFVGDRVAMVAAETPELAEQALRLIEVEYEELPAVLDPRQAMQPDAPIIHDEPDYVPFADSDPNRNLAAQIRIDIGDVEQGFAEADYIFEAEYTVHKVQQAHLEPHVAITWWDEDDRLVIRTSTQVPFHVRRQLAPVLGLPIKRIRVIKPRIGGGFGGKQEVLIEDVPAHLTIATGRPVYYEYTREEEFLAARSRHPMIIRMKTGVKKDGTITANEMYLISDTGAYGGHALTVAGNTGHKAMALYVGDGPYRQSPNIRFYADVVYTNTPPSGAFRGYGVPQGFWPVERHMEKIAHALGLDPIEFRLKNALRPGELHPFSTAWSEGREPRPETIETNALAEAVALGKRLIDWDAKYGNPEWHTVPGQPHLRRGIGVALVMQGTAIPYLDMGGASIKLNEDGSFNLLVGATDLGTGSDTVLAQMAAEILGVPLDDIIVYSSDTDFTPFDKGAYASSTTYISGAAVVKAAEQVAARLRERAAAMLNARGDGPEVRPDDILLEDRKAIAPDGRFVTLAEIGHHALHHADQEQIMAVASHMSPVAPPPFAAQFAEVTVDTQTGAFTVDRLLMVVDAGVIVNPVTASGQIEGGMTQALGYATSEAMTFDERGRVRERSFRDYHIYQAHEMPELEVAFVETFEPSHPFGVKAVAEIPMDGVAPAVGNAIYDAVGVHIDDLPITPEKVWQALQSQKGQRPPTDPE